MERPYKCSLCHAEFACAEGLTKHQRTHTGEMCGFLVWINLLSVFLSMQKHMFVSGSACYLFWASWPTLFALAQYGWFVWSVLLSDWKTSLKIFGFHKFTLKSMINSQNNAIKCLTSGAGWILFWSVAHSHMFNQCHLWSAGTLCPSEVFSIYYNIASNAVSCLFSGEKPYPCTYPNCKKAFKTSGDRVHHMRTHQKRPYECKYPDCGKKYTDPSSLRKHMRCSNHNTTGEWPSGGGERIGLSIDVSTC